jgi:DNA recombination protein RmuC
VDSKFSLENYNRLLETRDPTQRELLERQFRQDLKNRIDETSKYVKPSEGTMDFAFMFIPSEAVFYDLLINKVGAVKIATQDLIEYAFKERRVIIVSPTSFLAYLQTVLQGLRALQIEESAKEMRKFVQNLGRHLLSYEDYLKKLGKNLGATVSIYDRAYGEFQKIDKDIYRITGEGIDSERLLIAKPHEEE